MYVFDEVYFFLFEILNLQVCTVCGSCLVFILKIISMLGTEELHISVEKSVYPFPQVSFQRD